MKLFLKIPITNIISIKIKNLKIFEYQFKMYDKTELFIILYTHDNGKYN